MDSDTNYKWWQYSNPGMRTKFQEKAANISFLEDAANISF